MAKRRAEDTLLHDSPHKRCYRSLCSVDLRLESMAASEDGSPPSLLALLGSRCRKRSCYFDDPEQQQQQQQQQQMALHRKTTHCSNRNHAASVHTSGSSQDCRSSTTVPNAKKRPREDRPTPAETDMDKDGDRVDANSSSEDVAYNSYQYWRVPLPELDLSLLEDASDLSQPKHKSKIRDSSADAMET